MSIEWKLIRTFNNSQNDAFEELVCQLAREEEFEDKKEFFRTAAPDGGVEAYCVLKNGDEYGWQVKYFSSMGSSQWSQLTKSFKTAFRTHPNLKKYFICIPLDRQDPRKDKEVWFMDQWNRKTQEWTNYAQAQGREISFEYWGGSELIHRLSQEKHAGRILFWFSQYDFSTEWFKNQVKTSITNLGTRYTPELNVELDIARNFDSIIRNKAFRRHTKKNFHVLFLKIKKVLSSLQRKPLQLEANKINTAVANLEIQFCSSQKTELNQIDVGLIKKNIKIIEYVLSQCDKYINNEDKKDNRPPAKLNQLRIIVFYCYLFFLCSVI